MKIVGVDLAGVDRNPTGFAVVNGFNTKTVDLFSDSEILDAITSALVGQLYRKGDYIALWIKEEAQIITAKQKNRETLKKLKDLGVL